MRHSSSRNFSALIAPTVLFAISLAILGCKVEPRDFQSPVTPPEQTAAITPSENPLPSQWWLAFNDPQLNQLIDRALTDNFDIKIAWDRLAQFQAVARKAGADLYPQLDFKFSPRYEVGDVLDNDIDTWRYTLGLNARYEIDLWGRVRSAQQAALLDAVASRENVNVAAITLTGNIAAKYYELAEAQKQIRVLQSQIDTNNAVLEILELRFHQGQSQAADILRQKNLIESNRGSLILKKRDEALIRYQLAVLIGLHPTAELPISDAAMIDLPPLPGTGLPAHILQRRPDVRSAYRNVQSADLKLAEAIADQYPRFSITADFESRNGQGNDIFNNWLLTLAANITQPLLDGDRRKAEVQRNEAAVSESINEYAKTLLDSLQEVEQAIERENKQALYIKSLAQQLETSNLVIERARDSYLNGQLNYIDVLAALTTQQNLERQYVTARREHIGYRIDLCKAIAGSWELNQPELTEFKVAKSNLSPDQPVQP